VNDFNFQPRLPTTHGPSGWIMPKSMLYLRLSPPKRSAAVGCRRAGSKMAPVAASFLNLRNPYFISGDAVPIGAGGRGISLVRGGGSTPTTGRGWMSTGATGRDWTTGGN
jgi:hypothetical protein